MSKGRKSKLNVRTQQRLKQLANDIRSNLEDGVASIIRLGQCLNEAKSLVPYGHWMQFVDGLDLGFKLRTVERYIELATAPNFLDSSTWTNLPPHRGALRQLMKLPYQDFKDALSSGEIKPGMTCGDAKRLVENNALRHRFNRPPSKSPGQGSPEGVGMKLLRVERSFLTLERAYSALEPKHRLLVLRDLWKADVLENSNAYVDMTTTCMTGEPSLADPKLLETRGGTSNGTTV